VDEGLIRSLAGRESGALRERTRRSEAMYGRAAASLAGGVTSSFHGTEPWPIYLERGDGARVWDVDGNEYTDFHNGFSAMVQGHAHPAIGAAVIARHALGTHFGATSEDAIWVAEELGRRFGLPRWCFTNSGTESTLAAVRIARAFTERSVVVRTEGAYHGHAELGEAREVPFNDPAALERALATGHRPACVLMEAAMTSGGLVLPEPGYLEAVRELTLAHGVLLVFDEVKTGLTLAPGGAVERFGVIPDMVTLAKSLGGGLPSGAVGMTPELALLVEEGRVLHRGTFNGNPLSMAAARASLAEVLTPAAYERLERLGARLAEGCAALIARHELPGRVLSLGCRGCVQGQPPELAGLAWTWLMNRGVFTTPGRGQEWNVTVAHDDAAVERYLEAFAGLAAELSPRLSGSARA
jgi:glutamate-1-semialdehyde 2,1-aminomutase